jgi:undecaprenyl-diphosphatase
MTNKKNFVIPGVIACAIILLAYKKQGLSFIVATGLAVVVSDVILHQLIKPLVGRVRPCHALEILRHIANCSGSFSFPSNHASNAFTVATIASLGFRKAAVMAPLFIIAAFIALSRVYLGQHYPTDILMGALWGSGAGYLGHKADPKIMQYLNTWPKIEQWTSQKS